MKKLVTLLFALEFAISVFSQVPEKMSYQAIVRNESGELIKSSNIGMRISILQGSETGTAVYVETNTKTTNENGLVTLEIGGGTLVTGSFQEIDWSTGIYFIKAETDPAGGTDYTITGTSQLLSVPYALNAKNSGSVPALITQDNFDYTAPFKNFWTTSVTGGATISLSNSAAVLNTNSSSGVAKLTSNKQKSVTDGRLIFTAVLYTYQDNNTAYGPLARGLVNGTNRSNAIEFVNINGNTIQARSVAGGNATTTNYSVGATVDNFYAYTIIASTNKVEFYLDGILIATHTTNIPVTPLNMYFDASTWSGNVPQAIDFAKFEIVRK